jgi:predicted DNA-binding transcriptional regulator AlpA
VRKLLVAKKSTEEILKEVKRQFPKARTSPSSVAWYRSELRGRGKLPKV